MDRSLLLNLIGFSPCFLLAGIALYAWHRGITIRIENAAYKRGYRHGREQAIGIGFVSDMQRDIHAWHRRNFPTDDARDSLLGIGEELGEVMRAQVKQSGGIRGTFEYWQEEKKKEIGDVLIGIVNYCEWNDISVLDALASRWNVIGKRDYIKHPVDGGRENES